MKTTGLGVGARARATSSEMVIGAKKKCTNDMPQDPSVPVPKMFVRV